MKSMNSLASLVLMSTCALSCAYIASAETAEVYSPDRLLHGHGTGFNTKAFAEALFNLEVFRIQDPASLDLTRPPFFLDMRDTYSNGQIQATIISGIIEASKKFKFDCVCGTPITGKRWASLFSQKTRTKLITIREGRLEGNFKPGESCLVLDDVLASGKTIIESFHAIKNAGLSVAGAIVAVDKEEGGYEWITSRKKIRITALSKVSSLIQVLKQEGKISDEEVEIIANYLKKKKQQRLAEKSFDHAH